MADGTDTSVRDALLIFCGISLVARVLLWAEPLSAVLGIAALLTFFLMLFSTWLAGPE
jgi:hypothetical protein